MSVGTPQQRGMSLIELLLVMALLALLSVSALAIWRAQMIRVGQAEARVVMLHNARYLEQVYARYQRYRISAVQDGWAPLADRGARFYHIDFLARSEQIPGRYRLIARPRYAWLGAQYLLMDQDGLIVVCRKVEPNGEDCHP